IVLFWPLLWKAPIKNFIYAFKIVRNFGAKSVYYFGNFAMARDLPWHYIPVWIAVTTPITCIISFIIGCLVFVKRMITHPIRSCANYKQDFIFASWFFLPIIAVFVSESGIYDGWRHMFFIYPGFLMFSLLGLVVLFRFIKIKLPGFMGKVVNIILTLAICFNLVYVIKFMVEYHPHQNVYFNILAGRDPQEIRKNFELDYWGLAYRQGLEYILENDKSEIIPISVENWPGVANINILPVEDAKRLRYVFGDMERAKYLLAHHRGGRSQYPLKEYHSIKVNGLKILVIYKIN
ncbi:hypothetical protein ACFL96_17095, partial [Thermoproteota archaeon]